MDLLQARDTQGDPTAIDAYDLATQIAKYLTGPARWRAVVDRDGHGAPSRDFAALTRDSDGATIGVRVDGHRAEGRVTFRALWPRFRDGRRFTPRAYLSITCRADRAPTTLAREIERRLLPDYDPAYRDAVAYVRASDAAAADAADAAERIARALGAALPDRESYRQQRNGDTVEILGGPSNLHRLRVYPPSGDRPVEVSFEVTGLDEKTALRLFALLRTASAEGGR